MSEPTFTNPGAVAPSNSGCSVSGAVESEGIQRYMIACYELTDSQVKNGSHETGEDVAVDYGDGVLYSDHLAVVSAVEERVDAKWIARIDAELTRVETAAELADQEVTVAMIERKPDHVAGERLSLLGDFAATLRSLLSSGKEEA